MDQAKQAERRARRQERREKIAEAVKGTGEALAGRFDSEERAKLRSLAATLGVDLVVVSIDGVIDAADAQKLLADLDKIRAHLITSLAD